MVRNTLSASKKLIGITLTGALLMITACTSKPPIEINIAEYHEALNRTATIPPPEAGSAIEQRALKLFDQFYQDYSVENIQAGVRTLYDEEAWFGDPFHQVAGIDAIEHYFVSMAEPVESCTFTVESIQRADNDYYARWTMSLISKAAPDQRIEAIGFTHFRLNPQGKITFHQDHWDTSVMFDRLPVVGFWTRLVKQRIHKNL
jgi:steroid Delta-isomerase